MSNLDWSALANVATIDVETANERPASICQLAVVHSDASGKVTSKAWLIQPPANRYEAKNISVHGITPEHTADAPRLKSVWPEIVEAIDDCMLIAHNAEFDIDCISKAMQHYKLEWAPPVVGCTLRMADLLLPDRAERFTLGALCEAFGIPLENAHDAAADAEAAHRLALALHARAGGQTIAELIERSNDGWELRRKASTRRLMYANSDPATDRQLAYIRSLLEERGRTMSLKGLTKGQASRTIDELKAIPRRSGSQRTGAPRARSGCVTSTPRAAIVALGALFRR